MIDPRGEESCSASTPTYSPRFHHPVFQQQGSCSNLPSRFPKKWKHSSHHLQTHYPSDLSDFVRVCPGSSSTIRCCSLPRWYRPPFHPFWQAEYELRTLFQR